MSEERPNIDSENAAAGAINAFVADMPELNINQLIDTIYRVAQGELELKPAVKEYAGPYISYAKVYARNQAKELLNRGIDAIGIKSSLNNDFSDQLINAAQRIGNIVRDYIRKDITEQDFVDRIGESGIREINLQVLAALHIPEKLGVENLEALFELSPATVAYLASVAAYKEVKKAFEDLEEAHARRLEIEAACEQSIAMIRKYRMEMEQVVSKYLVDRYETFEKGFAAMDQALIEGDSDGYIRGNSEIQAILGYKMQFQNQNEFDALMDSDTDFIL